MATYTQSQLPSDVFNASSGDVKNFNGQQVKVTVNPDGTRSLDPVSSSNASAFDPVAQARQLNQFNVEQNQPVISSLQSQIPTTQAAYAQRGSALASQSQNLQQRYQSVLDSLSSSENTETKNAQIASSREFGARGVPLSSGAYDQYLAQQTNPITQYYAAQRSGAGAQFGGLQNQLTDLIGQNPIQEQQAEEQIKQSIAQLQAGNPSDAIQQALQQYQLQQSAQNNAAQLAIQQALLPAQQSYYSGRGNYYNSDAQNQQALALLNALKGQNLGNASGTLPPLSSIFGG